MKNIFYGCKSLLSLPKISKWNTSKVEDISYIFYEKRSFKEYLGFLFTITYSFILIILNFLNIIVGPYPFLRIKEQSIIMSIIWSIVILGGSYFVGIILNYFNKQKEEA